MKTHCYFLIIAVVIAVSCKSDNNDIEPEPPCVSNNALTPCGAVYSSWECMNMPRPDDSYNFPVCPGMEEWGDFKTAKELDNACEVPPCVLQEMSTQAVIQALWEHPLLITHFLAIDYKYGNTDDRFARYGAYLELCTREDAGAALLYRLLLVNPIPKGLNMQPQVLELLLSNMFFLSQLDDNEKHTVISTVITNDDLRQADEEGWGVFLRHSVWLLIGRTMYAADYIPFVEEVNNNEELRLYLNGRSKSGYPNTYFPDSYSDMIHIIKDFSINYLNEQ